jgi:hypothetical protein
MAKQKSFKYHTSHSFVDDKGNTISFATQLYQIGVYGIINNNPTMQGTFKPKDIVKIEKQLNKQKENGQITELTFGREIEVAEVDGFWKVIN